jgi:hypothetical protein
VGDRDRLFLSQSTVGIGSHQVTAARRRAAKNRQKTVLHSRQIGVRWDRIAQGPVFVRPPRVFNRPRRMRLLGRGFGRLWPCTHAKANRRMARPFRRFGGSGLIQQDRVSAIHLDRTVRQSGLATGLRPRDGEEAAGAGGLSLYPTRHARFGRTGRLRRFEREGKGISQSQRRQMYVCSATTCMAAIGEESTSNERGRRLGAALKRGARLDGEPPVTPDGLSSGRASLSANIADCLNRNYAKPEFKSGH